MKRIEDEIKSYYDSINYSINGKENKINEYFNSTSISKVRSSRGHKIKSFQELILNVAIVARLNNQFDLFFRGQREDCKDKNGRTIIYPKICRPEKNKQSIRTKKIELRYRELNNFCKYYKHYSFSSVNYPEYYYALIQHYELLPTPLIDITQSVRTAASFALEKTESGFFYVFGLPYPQGSISHFIDLNITLVKLLSVCPADAKRPQYQEGFLVGKLPFYPKKEAGDNLARRLIAKFDLDNSDKKFWDEDFKPLPQSVIKPKDDPIEDSLNYHYENYKAQQPTSHHL